MTVRVTVHVVPAVLAFVVPAVPEEGVEVFLVLVDCILETRENIMEPN